MKLEAWWPNRRDNDCARSCKKTKKTKKKHTCIERVVLTHQTLHFTNRMTTQPDFIFSFSAFRSVLRSAGLDVMILKM